MWQKGYNKEALPGVREHTFSTSKGRDTESLSSPLTVRAPHSPQAWKKPTIEFNIAHGHRWLSIAIR